METIISRTLPPSIFRRSTVLCYITSCVNFSLLDVAHYNGHIKCIKNQNKNVSLSSVWPSSRESLFGHTFWHIRYHLCLNSG